MENWKQRTEALIGNEGCEKLENAKVIIYGIGGVGSFACEGLVRAGIGSIAIVDNDTIDITNINRQIHANINTIGSQKIIAMKERILSINPKCNVEIYSNLDNEENLIDNTYAYVIDAVDTVKTKIQIIRTSKEKNVEIISAMGVAKKMEPSMLKVSNISRNKSM